MGFFGNIGIGKTVLIENWLEEMDIKNYTINRDYTIDIKGSVFFGNKNITELPEYIQFGTVKGNFNISTNPITTLRGGPKKVGGSFYCYECKNLKSLEGAPEKVGGCFYCFECNNLISLKGSSKKVGEHFNCCECNSLTTLEGAPKEVGGGFNCGFCKNLTSLEGAPEYVGGNFDCGKCGDKFTVDDVKKYSTVNGKIYNKI